MNTNKVLSGTGELVTTIRGEAMSMCDLKSNQIKINDWNPRIERNKGNWLTGWDRIWMLQIVPFGTRDLSACV